jgi:hypothetical protein
LPPPIFCAAPNFMRDFIRKESYVAFMLLWILALVLFGTFALAGYTLGAVRLAASLVGLLLGALLAVPLGHLLYPVLRLTGVKNPLLLWVLGPFVVFLIILIACKIGGLFAHRKVDIFYKYNAHDIQIGLWNRLNPRLGLCLGLANAAVYVILISWVIYAFSYATFQLVTGDNASWSVRMLNMAGQELQGTGMNKVAASIDSMPQAYYQTADTMGMIYHNDLLEGRLSRYPGFLALEEEPQFQDIAQDEAFTELRQSQPPISQIIDNPKAQAIIGNPDMLNHIWAIVKPNLTDLQEFLKTGLSAKYDDEKILGRWDFDLVGALNLVKRAKPDIDYEEMQRTREVITLSFGKTTFMASPEPERLAVFKNYGKYQPPAKPKLPPTVEKQSYKGQWSSNGDKYSLTFNDKNPGSLTAVVDGDRMTIDGDTFPLVFTREY